MNAVQKMQRTTQVEVSFDVSSVQLSRASQAVKHPSRLNDLSTDERDKRLFIENTFGRGYYLRALEDKNLRNGQWFWYDDRPYRITRIMLADLESIIFYLPKTEVHCLRNRKERWSIHLESGLEYSDLPQWLRTLTEQGNYLRNLNIVCNEEGYYPSVTFPVEFTEVEQEAPEYAEAA